MTANAADNRLCTYALAFESLAAADKTYATSLVVWAPSPAKIWGRDFLRLWNVSQDRAKQLIQTLVEKGLLKRQTDGGDILEDVFFVEPEATAFFETLED